MPNNLTETGDLWRRGALDLAAAIRSRAVSSRDVVVAHLGRITAVDPVVNAVPVVLAERALAAADAADRAITDRTNDLPPLHGVPFTVKGNIDLVGTPTTQGARALKDAYPTTSAPAVARLEAAGAIPLGHTNLPTYAIRWHTDSELWGPTVNPWDPARTPGASSGGEAAAIATGMSPLGLGNDTLGSLRWPAQCCGIATLKPTLGRIPHASSVGAVDLPIGPQLAGVVGPMARSVADLRLAFELLAGPTWRDPWSVPAPLTSPDPIGPVRVAVVLDPAGHGTAQQVQDGIRRAARALEDAGYVVEETEPPSIDLAAATLLGMLDLAGLSPAELGQVFPGLPPETARFLVALREVADRGAVPFAASFLLRSSLLRAWSEFQERHPLILAPIGTDPPFAVGTDLEEDAVADTVRALRMTLAVSALGLPAVAVPVGVAAGLPQVVQVVGPRYREDLCLDAAAAIEHRVGLLTPIDPLPASGLAG